MKKHPFLGFYEVHNFHFSIRNSRFLIKTLIITSNFLKIFQKNYKNTIYDGIFKSFFKEIFLKNQKICYFPDFGHF